MPWEHCGAELHDDAATCPSCGADKAHWTLQWEATRTFTVSRRRLVRLEVLDEAGDPLSGEPYRLVFPDGSDARGEVDAGGFAKAAVPDEVTTCAVLFPHRQAGTVVAVDPEGQPLEGVEGREDEGSLRFDDRPIGEKLRFRVRTGRFLKLRVLEGDGTPAAGLRYVLLTADGDRSGETDGEGVLYEPALPPGEVRVRLEDGRLLSFDLPDEPEEEAEGDEGDEDEGGAHGVGEHYESGVEVA